MNFLRLSLTLSTSPEQAERLFELQRAFAQACNLLAPVVRDHRCWNRVALHHLAYRSLRQALPALGSQMACNAIYSVCRAARLVYQHSSSPFNVAGWGDKPLPLLRFADSCPVYFDRHTLSLRQGQLSMFTLDGRLRFQLSLQPEQEAALKTMRLREVVLAGSVAQGYVLTFALQDEGADESPEDGQKPAVAEPAATEMEWPEYLMLEEDA
jgi:hypothetical protein